MRAADPQGLQLQSQDGSGGGTNGRVQRWRAAAIAAPLVFIVGIIVLGYYANVHSLVNRFDSLFLLYNSAFALAAVITPLTVAYFYVKNMREEKLRRLEADLFAIRVSAAQKERLEAFINKRLDYEFRFRSYVGSVSAAMVITAFGAATLLFLVPVPVERPSDVTGYVDFSKGANFLILGPAMADIGHYDRYFYNLVHNLTAFQFGFLGAWTYFITDLTRRYFTCDLTPNTFVSGTSRMIIASLLTLVASYALPVTAEAGSDSYSVRNLLPLVGFFFGFFPSSALAFIRNAVSQIPSIAGSTENRPEKRPVSDLSGISYMHQVRLEQEGIDSVGDLSRMKAVDLATRTGFGYSQLQYWIGEAWLRIHLGDEDYARFADATGILTLDELVEYFEDAHDKQSFDARMASLSAIVGDAKLAGKTGIVARLAAQSHSDLRK